MLWTFYDLYLLLKLRYATIMNMFQNYKCAPLYISDRKCFASTHLEEFVIEKILHGE
jgi:hypothetical protein